jgi:hypothetical protein
LISDYALSTPTASVAAAITPAPLTVSLTNTGVTKTYDGTPVVPTTFTPNYTIGGFVAGDTAATIVNAGSAYNNSNVIGATSVTVNGLSVSAVSGTAGSVGTDYSVPAGSASVAASITAAPVTLSGAKVADGTTTFAAAAFGTAGMINTGIGTETLAISGSGGVANAAAGPAQALTLGTLAIGDATGLASNYTIATTGNTGTINAIPPAGPAAAPLTITQSTTVQLQSNTLTQQLVTVTTLPPSPPPPPAPVEVVAANSLVALDPNVVNETSPTAAGAADSGTSSSGQSGASAAGKTITRKIPICR